MAYHTKDSPRGARQRESISFLLQGTNLEHKNTQGQNYTVSKYIIVTVLVP